MHLKDTGDRIQAVLNSVDSHFLLYFWAAPRPELHEGAASASIADASSEAFRAVGRDQHFHARAELCASLA